MIHHIARLLLWSLLLGFPAAAWALTGTSSATIKIYKAYFSTSGTCASPFQTIDFGSDGKTVDFAATPDIGSGSIAAGTYKCVIFKMSDSVSFIPSASDGSLCVAGTTYTMDVCSTQGDTTPSYTDPETGTSTSCTSGNDTTFVYISRFVATTEGGEGTNAFIPPTADGDTARGMKLSDDIVINATATGTFTFGTANKVNGAGSGGPQGLCNMEAPDFGFKLSS